MIIRLFRLSFLLSCFWGVSVAGAVSPAGIFQEGAVLQHGKPVPVWGTASPGENVTVAFAGQSVSAQADSEGRWTVTLDALEPTSEPREMVISGGETVTLSDVVVGEVWLASGQSNMEWRLNRSYELDIEVATASWPLIREFKFPRTTAEEPSSDVLGSWTAATPETVGEFSAVGYFFAQDIHRAKGMPVGIILSAWGGTRVEPWTSAETLGEERFEFVHDRHREAVANYESALVRHETATARWEQQREEATAAGREFTRNAPTAPREVEARHIPSYLYNGMIHPLVPYAIRGAIWYQGESNAARHDEYHELFGAMIDDWRKQFQQGDFPFYWVQLSEFRADGVDETRWAFLREAQTQTLNRPATGQVVTLDIGDVHDIHPRDKKRVGRRLARLALNRTYGFDVIDSGPVFSRAEFNGPEAQVYFDHVADGLRTTAVEVRGFELAGEDQVFHPARATVARDTVTLVSDEVPSPVAIRYAWRNAPEATLSNGAGLPAVPFRTDSW